MKPETLYHRYAMLADETRRLFAIICDMDKSDNAYRYLHSKWVETSDKMTSAYKAAMTE